VGKLGFPTFYSYIYRVIKNKGYMAIWQFQNLNKYGNIRTRIVYRQGGESFGINPNNFGPIVMVKRFKYTYKHSLLPPSLFISPTDGKTFIVPTWQEVIKGTTVEDIEWIKPKIKVETIKVENVVVKTPSSKGDTEYITTYYPTSGKYHCTCPGTWRTGGNCKHIKELRVKIGK
jgi:hypothetical protein